MSVLSKRKTSLKYKKTRLTSETAYMIFLVFILSSCKKGDYSYSNLYPLAELINYFRTIIVYGLVTTGPLVLAAIVQVYVVPLITTV